MKVKDLIEILQKGNPDHEVYTVGYLPDYEKTVYFTIEKVDNYERL